MVMAALIEPPNRCVVLVAALNCLPSTPELTLSLMLVAAL
jgi:hypothetical protein